MISTVTFKELIRKVRFPVYAIKLDDAWVEDGLVFLDDKIVDDRNQPYDSLGLRRLHTPHTKKALNRVYFSFIELLDSKSLTFIDSNGWMFEYQKTSMTSIQSMKIKKKVSKDTFSLVFVKGTTSPFIVKRYPHSEEWAQILMYENLPWQLYSLSDEFIETSKRKI